ncbi:MAG: hypothetical protein ACOYOA_00485 [Saprospiraceae bacterium]
MKQNLKISLKQIGIVSAVLFVLMCLSTNAIAQKTTPVKDLTDIMLSKRASLELIERALGEWGADMLNSADSSATKLESSSARFALLFATNNIILEKRSDNVKVSSCIEEAAKLVWSQNLVTSPAAYQYAVDELGRLLNRKRNTFYKDNY